MTWKTKGKIGCHFPDRTGLNPNFDVTRVVYSQDGVAANAKEIEKVYYISPAAAEAIAAKSTHEERMAELAKWLVWQRYWEAQRILVEGTTVVAIEYKPENDIVVSTVAIFTQDDVNANSVAVQICHESGLVLACATTDTKANMTLYGLSGIRRTAEFNNITLKGGETYYICYAGTTQGAITQDYFQNESGNYKVYETNQTNPTYLTPYPTGEYLGSLTTIKKIIEGSNDDYFTWDSNVNYGYFTNTWLYVRNNLASNTYAGEFGSGNFGPADAEFIFNSMTLYSVALWLGYNDSGLIQNYLYQKTSNLPDANYEITFADYSGAYQQLGQLLLYLNNTSCLCKDYIWSWANWANNLAVLKTGYSIQFNSLTPTAKPADADAVDKGFYYLNDGNYQGIYVYENSSWLRINQYGPEDNGNDKGITNYVEFHKATECLTQLGQIQTYIAHAYSPNDVTIHTNLRTAAIEPDRKYYLAVNGDEK